MYCKKKTQTGATFMALLHEIKERSEPAMDLPVYATATVLMDCAPCHKKEFFEEPNREERSLHLPMVKEISNLWVSFLHSSEVSSLQP